MANTNLDRAGVCGFVFALLAACFFWVPYVGGILWIIGAILSCVGLGGKRSLYAWVGFVISVSWLLLYFLFGVINATFMSFAIYPLVWW